MDTIKLNIVDIGGIILKRKLASIFLIIAMIITPIFANAEVDITSKAAILVDYNTGKVIYALNEHEKLQPASVTKIMTLLLTMEAIASEKIKLDDKVIISDYASSMGGTQVYLEPGESQTVENLIKAASIRSANDASVALGEFVSGSNETFIKLMNTRAKELGMLNTNFENSTGLPNDNHYTTAFDISLMSRELLKHDKIHKYLTTWMDELVVGKKKDDTQVMVNTNKLIKEYEGITGIKTGSINASGYCVSASAKRGDLQLVAVILGGINGTTRFNEAKKLLDYGFSNYQTVTFGKKGDIIANIPIDKAKDLSLDIVLERDAYALLPKDSKGRVAKDIVHPTAIEPPVSKGDKLGELIITLDGVEIEKINLVAKTDINKAGYLLLLKRALTSFITGK